MITETKNHRNRFQFSLGTLLWFAPACAVCVVMWVRYRNGQYRLNPLSTAFLGLGLIVSLNGSLVWSRLFAVRRLSERLISSALMGLIIGLGVHFYVIRLLASTGAIFALTMREDDWGNHRLNGVVVRVLTGIMSALVLALIGVRRANKGEE